MPHTKQYIQSLLQAAQIKPRHRWGQNFLIDLNLMRLLVDRAEWKKNDVVLEVGCGTGSLTRLLAEPAGYVVVVDIDPFAYFREVLKRVSTHPGGQNRRIAAEPMDKTRFRGYTSLDKAKIVKVT